MIFAGHLSTRLTFALCRACDSQRKGGRYHLPLCQAMTGWFASRLSENAESVNIPSYFAKHTGHSKEAESWVKR